MPSEDLQLGACAAILNITFIHRYLVQFTILKFIEIRIHLLQHGLTAAIPLPSFPTGAPPGGQPQPGLVERTLSGMWIGRLEEKT